MPFQIPNYSDAAFPAQASPDAGDFAVIVAGTGQSNVGPNDAPFGDGGPATQAKLITYPAKLAFGADGSLYFVDLHAIRRIRPDGIIERVDKLRAGGTARPAKKRSRRSSKRP